MVQIDEQMRTTNMYRHDAQGMCTCVCVCVCVCVFVCAVEIYMYLHKSHLCTNRYMYGHTHTCTSVHVTLYKSVYVCARTIFCCSSARVAGTSPRVAGGFTFSSPNCSSMRGESWRRVVT